MEFEGQHVIVTGGTRGIGRALSLAFLERGATVTATYVSGGDAAKALAEQAGERLKLAQFDVSEPAAVESFWDSLDEAPQVLVNNAGIRRDAIAGMQSVDDWRKVMDVNLGGSFLMSKFAVRAMSRQRYGRILFITSPSADLGIEGQGAYAASKAGQTAFARSLSKEVAKRKITVNCVCPGFIETELIADLDAEQRKAYTKTVPLRRFGQPEEVAHAVLFLASKGASYITGTTLRVAGGL